MADKIKWDFNYKIFERFQISKKDYIQLFIQGKVGLQNSAKFFKYTDKLMCTVLTSL